MADRYLLESGTTDGYLLEDGTGVLLLDAPPPTPVVAGIDSANNDSVAFPVNVPAGTANGDLLIGVVASDWNTDANSSFPTPAWTRLATSSHNAGTDAFHVGIYVRVASSEPASYTVGLGTSSGNVAAIMRITGWDSTAGLAGAVKEVAPIQIVGGTSAVVAPSIVPYGTDDLLITFHGAETSSSGARTWTPPSGMIEDLDRQSTIWTSLEISHLANPSNPSGTKTATPSASVDNGGACTISIKAATTGGASLTLSLSTETDAALVLSNSKVITLGVATETDAAFAVSVTKTRAVTLSLATETDAGLAPSLSKTITLGVATETDTAPALSAGASASFTLSLATETDTAYALSYARAMTLGLGTETDAAYSVVDAKAVSVSSATESDAAYSLSVTKSRTVQLDVASEVDAAYALSVTKARTVTLSVATETSTAPGVSVAKLRPLGVGTETDTAFTITTDGQASALLSRAQETDTALGLSGTKSTTLGIATETDAPGPLSVTHSISVGRAAEVDAALGLAAVKMVTLGVAVETEAAHALIGAHTITLGVAQEVDVAYPIISERRDITITALGVPSNEWAVTDLVKQTVVTAGAIQAPTWATTAPGNDWLADGPESGAWTVSDPEL